MSNYTFFFDESLHDRKIGLSDDGDFNFLKDASFDTYVGAFWGIRTKKLVKTKEAITAFEKRYKQIFGLSDQQELKSTTIKKKYFKYGLQSLNQDAYRFYDDLFELIHNINPVLHITMISKMELYIRQVFSNCDLDMSYVNADSFYYSITKFMLIYGTEQLRNELLSVQSEADMDQFICSIIKELKTIIYKTKEIARKQREREVFQQLIFILENSDNSIGIPNKQYDFEYRCSFDGLCRLLNEKRISIATTEVIIDDEKNTFAASQLYSFEKTVVLKSHESVELRMADWIVGFVARMVVAINRDGNFNEHIESLSELDEKDIVSKHLLSSKWFELDEATFYLYMKAFRFFIFDRSEEYWATMTAAYFDSTVLFYSLLRYFGSYDDFNTYKSIAVEMHAEYFNSCVCDELSRAYRERI